MLKSTEILDPRMLQQNRLFCGGLFWHRSGMAKKEKNAAAVALGRLGGLKGGKARAAKLSAAERRASARKAARARWANQKN
jgi:hypothetical protein